MASHFAVKAVYGISTGTVRFFSTGIGLRLSNRPNMLIKEVTQKLDVGRFVRPQLKLCVPLTSLFVKRSLSSRTCSRYSLNSLEWKTPSPFSHERLTRGFHHFVSVSARNGCCTQLPKRAISTTLPCAKKGEAITVHFLNKDGEKTTVKGQTGHNLLDTVLDNEIDIDGYGACEGTLACSTCHLIFSDEFFNMLPKPSDEELDMLDLAYGQTDKSRLGCQVILTKEMDGMTVTIPEGIADARDA